MILTQPFGAYYPNIQVGVGKYAHIHTCPPNGKDVFRIGQSVGILFFHSEQPIGSVDMCIQIKHVRFLDFLDFKVD